MKSGLIRECMMLAAVLCVAGFVLAGCGGESGESAPESSGETAQQVSSGSAPAADVEIETDEGDARITMTETGKDSGTVTFEGEEGQVAVVTHTGKDEGTMVFKDAAGEETGKIEVSRNKLPDGFPADFPVYEGAAVGGGKASADGADSYVAGLTTSDSVDKVISFYKKALPDKGYTIKMTMNMGQGTMIAFEKGSSLSGTVVAMTKDGQTAVNLTLTEK